MPTAILGEISPREPPTQAFSPPTHGKTHGARPTWVAVPQAIPTLHPMRGLSSRQWHQKGTVTVIKIRSRYPLLDGRAPHKPERSSTGAALACSGSRQHLVKCNLDCIESKVGIAQAFEETRECTVPILAHVSQKYARLTGLPSADPFNGTIRFFRRLT